VLLRLGPWQDPQPQQRHCPRNRAGHHNNRHRRRHSGNQRRIPKMSYSMTTWSPYKTVPPADPLQSGSGGGSRSSNGSAAPSWSSTPAPAPLEPSSYVSSWSTPSSSSSSSAVQPKVRKSYAMTSWSPNKPVPANAATGSTFLPCTYWSIDFV
jgi:hypothetical protein